MTETGAGCAYTPVVDSLGDDLVVPTPERVAFDYPVAGPGSRFLAQLIDGMILFALLIVLSIVAGTLSRASGQLAVLFAIVSIFLLIWGYFLVSEAVWSGQTVGKRALRLRVVGDHGEPITVTQAIVRNLVRIVDFLPLFYGIGLIALFANGKGKRLGDLAAGTLVVRERQRISLYDLTAASPAPASGTASPPAAPTAGAQTSPAAPAFARPLEPPLRRLVTAYGSRRAQLPLERRRAVAQNAEPALRRALPHVVSEQGALAALDQLADSLGVIPATVMHPRASAALGLGIASLACAVFVFYFPPVAIICGALSIWLGTSASRAVRSHPERFSGDQRARTGRLLGIIGTALSTLIGVVLFSGIVRGG
jgi:uncharacterized RDD family membrane protein YckC